MVASRQGVPSWVSAVAATRVDFEGNTSSSSSSSSSAAPSSSDKMFRQDSPQQHQQQLQKNRLPDANLGFGERSLSAAGAAFLSAIIVNPFDVVKVVLSFA